MAKKDKLIELYAKCIESNYTNINDEAHQLKIKVFALDLDLKYKKIEDLFNDAKIAYEENQSVLKEREELRKEKEAAIKKEEEKERNAKHALKIKGIKYNTFVDVFVCEDGTVFCCEGTEGSRTPNSKNEKFKNMRFSVESGGTSVYTYHPSKTIFTGAAVGGIVMGGTHRTKEYYSEHRSDTGTGSITFRYGDTNLGVEYVSVRSDFPDLLKRLPGYAENFKRNKVMCRTNADNSLDLKVALNSPDMATKMSILSIADEKTKLPYYACVDIANILNRVVYNNLPEPDEEIYTQAIELSKSKTLGSLAEAIERFQYLSDYKDANEQLKQIEPIYKELLQADKEQKVLKLEAEKVKKSKNKKIAAIVGIIAVICAIILSFVIKSINLKKAYELEAAGDYHNAMCQYTQLGDYKDAMPRAAELIKKNNLKSIATGRGFCVAVKTDGTVVATGDNEYGQCNVSDWKNVISIDTGFDHTVALKSDGTVVATGDNEKGQCDVDSWTNVIAIAAGGERTIGLTADGKILTTNEQDEVEGWKGIISIDAGYDGYIALKADGSVVTTATKINKDEYTFPSNTKAVAAGFNHFVALKDDGTVFATSYYYEGEDIGSDKREVYNWTDIVDIYCGEDTTFGIKSDSSVVFAGTLLNNYDLSVLKDVIYISEAPGLILALKEDGTIIATGDPQIKHTVCAWTDIAVYN